MFRCLDVGGDGRSFHQRFGLKLPGQGEIVRLEFLKVNFVKSLSKGTAIDGVDNTSVSNAVTFNPGMSVVPALIPILGKRKIKTGGRFREPPGTKPKQKNAGLTQPNAY